MLRTLNAETVAAAMATARGSQSAAARALGVNQSTISRWVKSGKVASAERPKVDLPSIEMPLSEWAESVRKARAPLTPTDEALIVLASEALIVARDLTIHAAVRLNAAGRFQALVKQLGLVTVPAVVPADKPKAPEVETRRRVDPRDVLRAIK